MIKYKIHLTVKGKTNIKKQLKTLIKIELILQMPKNHKINIKPYYFLGLTCAKAKGSLPLAKAGGRSIILY